MQRPISNDVMNTSKVICATASPDTFYFHSISSIYVVPSGNHGGNETDTFNWNNNQQFSKLLGTSFETNSRVSIEARAQFKIGPFIEIRHISIKGLKTHSIKRAETEILPLRCPRKP